MLIAIDASRANAQEKTGVGWYAYRVISELQHVIPPDVRVILYTREPLSDALGELPKNWTSQVLHWRPKILWTQIRLWRELLRDKPDCFFVPAHVVPVFYFGRSVVTIHDLAFRHFPFVYSWFEYFYQRFTIAYMSRQANQLIVPSQATREDLIHYSSARPEKIHVIPNGFDRGRYPLDETPDSVERNESIRVKYGIRKPYFVSIGRLEKKKNTVRIIEAFNRFRAESEPNAQLVLVGKPGFGFHHVRKAIDNSEYSKDILVTGYMHDRDMSMILLGAYALLFPSLYEGFGLPILEAQWCGVPVVTSNISSMREVAGDGALLVDPFHAEDITRAMGKIFSDQRLRDALINAGKRNVSRYDWSATAEGIGKVLMVLDRGDLNKPAI